MKKEILIALSERWDGDAVAPESIDEAESAERQNAIDAGIRQGKRECADGLRTLISLLT